MKCILVGYPGSQKIVPASRYLTTKYLPGHFRTIYLNYEGRIEEWSNYLVDYLSKLTDKYIIFALDDYLIADYIDIDGYCSALAEIGEDVVCAKLCHATPDELREYPVTTQYCIWDREYLISLLSKIRTPWEFEIVGSKLFDKKVVHHPCLTYFTNSSISGRWEGIRLDGVKEEDVKFIKQNGWL